jgi:RNA polymerase primary sigma factor
VQFVKLLLLESYKNNKKIIQKFDNYPLPRRTIDMFNDHNFGPALGKKRKSAKLTGNSVPGKRKVGKAAPKTAVVALLSKPAQVTTKASRKTKVLSQNKGEGLQREKESEIVPRMLPAPVAAEEISPGSTVVSALSAYFREVGSVPLLTREEEVELAAKIKKGDEAARERMIRANLRLVVKIARDYENLGLPLLDLISEGTIGLMKAVEKFDPAKGGKLSTYGSWWIKQQVRRALANQGRTIRLPVHVEGKLYRLGRAEAKLREELGREATDEELADELEVTPKRLARLRDAAIRPGSLDAPMGENSDATVGDLVRDERATTPSHEYESKADHGLLRTLIEKLPDRESQILRSRFGLDGENELTLEEIGHRFGVTRERIRQLQNEAFKKLRAMMEDPKLLQLAA